jgi:hypothetical protein
MPPRERGLKVGRHRVSGIAVPTATAARLRRLAVRRK